MAPLPRKNGEKQKVLLDWSHLEVSNPDCATYFVVKYNPANDKYGGSTVTVPSNVTSVELELKDKRLDRATHVI